MGVALRVKEAVERFAPAGNAESWDNTGVLVDAGGERDGGSVLLTIDLTDAVLDEAVEAGAAAVVAYHPVIFVPLRALTDARLVRCIRHGISVYSPHTQLDPLMNQFLREVLGGRPVSFEDALGLLKRAARLERCRVVRPAASRLYAPEDVVVGVGAAFRSPDFRDKLIVTGEMTHHDMLRAQRNGCGVILLEHSNSERLFLPELKRLLEASGETEGLTFLVSSADCDPVEIV